MTPLYDRWAREILGEDPPGESLATCGNCAMCRDREDDAASRMWFNPETKCCTYYPSLPNFLVGMLLADTSEELAEGRARIRQVIREGNRVTPWGLPASRDHVLRYKASGSAGFGLSSSLRCPYYIADSGACGIWRYRNAICSTWFCKFERGQRGKDFWDAMKDVLGRAERDLAKWCLAEVGLDSGAQAASVAELESMSPAASDLDRRRDESLQENLWSDWYGREEEFYLRCAELARNFDWSGVRAIGGHELVYLTQRVQALHAALQDDSLPRRVVLGGFQVDSADGSSVTVTGYRAIDPLTLSYRLYTLLPRFHDQALAECREEMRASDGISVSDGLLRKLLDYEVLKPRQEPGAKSRN